MTDVLTMLGLNFAGLIVAMKDMGFIARGADPEVFERVVDFFHDKFQAEVKLESLSLRELKLSPEKALSDLADLRKLNVSLRDLMQHFHVPKEWVLLERTLLLLLGLCTELAPELNPMQVIRPYVEEMVLGQDRDWSKFLVETTRDVVTQAAQLPGEMRKFLARAQRGQLEVRFRGLEEGARLIYAAGRQLTEVATDEIGQDSRPGVLPPGLDDILLKGLLANSSQADAYKLVILDESFGFEPYGLMFRRNDPEFKRIVDETLLGLYRSGEIERTMTDVSLAHRVGLDGEVVARTYRAFQGGAPGLYWSRVWALYVLLQYARTHRLEL